MRLTGLRDVLSLAQPRRSTSPLMLSASVGSVLPEFGSSRDPVGVVVLLIKQLAVVTSPLVETSTTTNGRAGLAHWILHSSSHANRGSIMSMRWQSLIGASVAIIGLSFLLLLISPVILLLPAQILNVNWEHLTNIGQSYTGAAAILSGAALAGVVLSIRFQIDMNALVSRRMSREMQFNLLQLAMSDDQYSSVFKITGLPALSDHNEYRRAVFRTQWMRYLEFAYLSNEMSIAQMQNILETEMFTNEENREWWLAVRPAWMTEMSGSVRRRRFIDAIDQSCARTAPPSPEPEA
jgi:hypothetical protein